MGFISPSRGTSHYKYLVDGLAVPIANLYMNATQTARQPAASW